MRKKYLFVLLVTLVFQPSIVFCDNPAVSDKANIHEADINKLRANGLTPKQVDDYFIGYVRQGGSYSIVQSVIENWYKEFQQEAYGSYIR